jgi:hypothetical protein
MNMSGKFLGKLLLFLLLVGGSMELTFVGARKLEKPFFEDSSYAWVNHLHVHPKILLMGSSTVLNNLSPGEITRVLGMQPGEVVNLGGGSKGALQAYHLWQVVAPNRDSVRVVFFSVDPWIAYQAYYWIEDFSTLYWNPIQRLYPGFVDHWPRYVMSGAVATDVLKKSCTHYFDWQTPNIVVPHDYGGEVLDIHLKNYREHARDYFGPVTLFPISQLYFDRIRELKNDVEAHGAEFVLMLPPKKKFWFEEYAQTCKDIDSDFVSHLNAALDNVKVIGSYQLFKGAIEDSLFMDHVHLSGQGQKRFSDYIAGIVDTLPRIKKSALESLTRY